MKFKLVTGLKYVSPASIEANRKMRFCSIKAAQKYLDKKVVYKPDAYSIVETK
jgi:hypothetical protein